MNRGAGYMNWARFQTEAGFPLATSARSAFGPIQLLVHWIEGKIFPHVKRPEPETDHSPNQATLRMRGAIHPLPLTP